MHVCIDKYTIFRLAGQNNSFEYMCVDRRTGPASLYNKTHFGGYMVNSIDRMGFYLFRELYLNERHPSKVKALRNNVRPCDASKHIGEGDDRHVPNCFC